ncbi:hypothetical protein F4X73_14640 [Candidatus Poribacteria bacterium]|nr:hypothetical protein [Candidatus Poribacteria bacterium]MYB65925.1 hypothetical protein [Candidatus Poribacteria bacterium]
MRYRYQHFLILFLSLILCPLSANQPEKNSELDSSTEMEIPPYARHLKGIKICLDPGHGGQEHIPDFKRGPTGLREAEINLKVAKYLKSLLEKVGATVIMTRDDDSYVSLADRSEIANENRVDFFISIHHNGINNHPEINYTSTWYHGDADDSRPSLDLARYIQRGVSDALRLPNSPSTGLYSDKLIVASGFGVLRMTKCPAIVCEASFYTNPEEEARLKNDQYLKREAYGYFVGIARYVEAGLPKGVLITPENESVILSKTPTIKIKVMDGLHERGAWMLKRQQVFTKSLCVKINGIDYPFQYDPDTDIITLEVKEPLANGLHFIQTDMVNYYGNHSLPQPQQFKIAPPATKIELNAWTMNMPYIGNGYVGIVANALDADGLPIADGEIVRAEASIGTLESSESTSEDGKAYFYLKALDHPSETVVEISYGKTQNSLKIHFTDIPNGVIQGHISNAASGDPISQVILRASPMLTAESDPKGHYFLKTDPNLNYPYRTTLNFSKQGFYPHKQPISIEQNKSTIVNVELHPIADSAFENMNIVIDTETDTQKTQQLISSLKKMLEVAGAKVFNIHTPGETISIEDRIKKVNSIKQEGYYLQINHMAKIEEEPIVIAKHNRGNRETEFMQKRILEQFNSRLYKTPIETIQDRETPIIQQTNKLAMTLEIRSIGNEDFTSKQEASAIFLGMWQFLKDDTEIEKQKIETFMKYYNGVQRDKDADHF